MGDGPVFSCTGCARCCRNLVDPASAGLPAHADALARQGLVPLPRVGGLQVWPWERRRLLAAAEARGTPMPFRPALAAVVDAPDGPLAVVLVWEYEREACALVTADDRCSVYGERPVVCRAYPLLLRSGAVAVSGVCPGAVMPAEAAALPVAYGGSYAAARAAARYPDVLLAPLAFLETAGRLRRRVATPAEAGALVAAGRIVDALDLLEREGVATQASVEAKCAALGVDYGTTHK